MTTLLAPSPGTVTLAMGTGGIPDYFSKDYIWEYVF